MIQTMIDFPNVFSQKQLEYIGQNVVEAAKQTCGDRLRDVILYGSYARGDFREWSDVDIMVLADADGVRCNQYGNDLLEFLFDLNYHMNLLLSIMVTPYQQFERFKKDYAFYRNVNTEGARLCLKTSA